MAIEKQVKGDDKHVKRFSVTLCFAVESRQVISDGTVRTLNEMCLCFSHGMGFSYW